MFDIGWQEIFLIGVVALIVIGPKDLPKAMRVAADLVRKARGMSREFQSGLAEMIREAELDELKRKLERSSRFNLEKSFKETVDPTGRLSAEFDPVEFAREIRERVDGIPPKRPETDASGSAEANVANKAVAAKTAKPLEGQPALPNEAETVPPPLKPGHP